MALARSRRDNGMNYWPGFVDALSTLILSIIFLLTVFMVAQFFLSQEVAGKDTALARLNAQISRLSDLLSLERTGKTSLEDEVAQLRASLSAAEGERERLRGAAESQNAGPGPGQVNALNTQIDLQKAATARAIAQIENLNLQIGALLGGAVVVETVFAWPGLGFLAYESLFARDINLLLGIFFISGCLVVAVNLSVDLMYSWLDPRIELR